MSMNRRISSISIAVLLGVIVVSAAHAADHLDAPLVTNDGRLDINDVYAFQSPDNPDNTVLIMTVNPAAGVISPDTLNPRGIYEFRIDNDGDARPEIRFVLGFSRVKKDGSQNVVLLKLAKGIRPRNAVLAFGKVGETLEFNSETGVSKRSVRRAQRKDADAKVEATNADSKLTVDTFEDPFFFDLNGFEDGLNFTGDDFFAGLNVTGIVLEVPSDSLGEGSIGVWSRTSRGLRRFDRMGRPAINTVLVPDEQKNFFNKIEPRADLFFFTDTFIDSLLGLGNDEPTAEALTAFLLPDILTIDPSDPSGFPNGRQLEDDVIDIELDLLTGGALTGDGVDANDVAFPGTFPYLAPANE